MIILTFSKKISRSSDFSFDVISHRQPPCIHQFRRTSHSFMILCCIKDIHTCVLFQSKHLVHLKTLYFFQLCPVRFNRMSVAESSGRYLRMQKDRHYNISKIIQSSDTTRSIVVRGLILVDH